MVLLPRPKVKTRKTETRSRSLNQHLSRTRGSASTSTGKDLTIFNNSIYRKSVTKSTMSKKSGTSSLQSSVSRVFLTNLQKELDEEKRARHKIEEEI